MLRPFVYSIFTTVCEFLVSRHYHVCRRINPGRNYLGEKKMENIVAPLILVKCSKETQLSTSRCYWANAIIMSGLPVRSPGSPNSHKIKPGLRISARPGIKSTRCLFCRPAPLNL